MALNRRGPGLFEKQPGDHQSSGHESSDNGEAETSTLDRSPHQAKNEEMDRMTLYLPVERKACLERMLLELRVAHRVNLPLTGLVRAVLDGVLQSGIDLGRAYNSRDRDMVEAEIARLIADRLANQ